MVKKVNELENDVSNMENTEFNDNPFLDFLEGINSESVDKASAFEQKPQLKILLNEEVQCEIISTPVKKLFADGNEYFIMNVKTLDGVVRELNAQATSIRFGLAVLLKQHGKIVGLNVLISKKLGDTKTRKDVKLYSIIKL